MPTCVTYSVITTSDMLETLKKLIEEEFRCPICLDLCDDTKISPDCGHRFCDKCIKESLQRCNNECPTCRVHIATYRTCRSDPQFDRIRKRLLEELITPLEKQVSFETNKLALEISKKKRKCGEEDHNKDTCDRSLVSYNSEEKKSTNEARRIEIRDNTNGVEEKSSIHNKSTASFSPSGQKKSQNKVSRTEMYGSDKGEANVEGIYSIRTPTASLSPWEEEGREKSEINEIEHYEGKSNIRGRYTAQSPKINRENDGGAITIHGNIDRGELNTAGKASNKICPSSFASSEERLNVNESGMRAPNLMTQNAATSRITFNRPSFYWGVPSLSLDSAKVAPSNLNMRELLQSKGWFGIALPNEISLSAHESAWSQSRRELRNLISMVYCDTIPVDTSVCQKSPPGVSACSRCNHIPESFDHVLRCKDAEAEVLWKSHIIALSTWLRKQFTSPRLENLIMKNLFAWKSGLAPAVTSRQDSIGWYSFFLGFIHVDLVDIQNRHYQSLNSSLSATEWASNLILCLWNICWALWEHRNKRLHNVNVDFSEKVLEQTIYKEFRKGIDILPYSFYPYFHTTIEELTGFSLKDRLTWLRVVRSGRESTNSAEPDLFSAPGPMRSWLGLPAIPVPQVDS